MKIFLIRHGEQEYPVDAQGRKLVSSPNAPLAELGRIQLRELGKELDKEGQTLDALYTSPFLRARQSAEVLAKVLSISDIHVINGLGETDPLSAEGKTYEELVERGGDIYAHPFSENQETLDHLVDRSRSAIEFILTDAKERGYELVGIVGHGDPLCALDWSLKHSNPPSSYAEMRDSYYPQKGQALEYTIDSALKVEGAGRLITTEAANQTIEGFRNAGRRKIIKPLNF